MYVVCSKVFFVTRYTLMFVLWSDNVRSLTFVWKCSKEWKWPPGQSASHHGLKRWWQICKFINFIRYTVMKASCRMHAVGNEDWHVFVFTCAIDIISEDKEQGKSMLLNQSWKSSPGENVNGTHSQITRLFSLSLTFTVSTLKRINGMLTFN